MVKFLTVVVTCILALVAVSGAARSAPSQAPVASPGAADCSTLIYSMVDCMTYLSGDGSQTKPDGTCCSGLNTLLSTNAACMCNAISMSVSLGLDINMTKAEGMPSACGISGAPSISSCTASITPGSSPANPPSAGASPSTQQTLPPTTQPPTTAITPVGSPVATSGMEGAPTPAAAPAPAHKKKSGAYTNSATFSTLFITVVSLSQAFLV